MLTILVCFCAVYMLVKGILMIRGKVVPVTAQTAIEDVQDRKAWCVENGRINLVWSADFAFCAIYLILGFNSVVWLSYVWLGIAIAVGVACCVASYKTNKKYFK